jgi:hypothetical protein
MLTNMDRKFCCADFFFISPLTFCKLNARVSKLVGVKKKCLCSLSISLHLAVKMQVCAYCKLIANEWVTAAITAIEEE